MSDQPLSLKDRAQGAAVGLAVADAFTWERARLSPEKSAGLPATSLPHGAVTTWALALTQALRFQSPSLSFEKELALQLQVLASPRRGAALRGAPGGFATALRQVAKAHAAGESARVAGLDEAVADPLPAMLPLAFTLNDSDADVAAALVQACAISHRHLRVATSAGLFIGGLRHTLALVGAPQEEIVDAALELAKEVVGQSLALRSGVVVGNPTEAEGAALMGAAAARAAERPTDVWAPAGLDGRDAPERCALGALVGLTSSSTVVAAVAAERSAQGGDADVVLPLWLAAVGATQGANALPIGLTELSTTKDAVAARMQSLFERTPPMRADLVVEELLWSEALDAAHASSSETQSERAEDQAKANAPPPSSSGAASGQLRFGLGDDAE